MPAATRLLMSSAGHGGFTTFNDEFNGTNSGWTMAGTNPPDIGVTTPGKLHMPSGSAAHRARIPTLPFTMEAYCSSLTFDSLSTPGGAGLNIAEASPGGPPGPKWWGMDMDIDTPGTTCVFDGRWTDFAHQSGHLRSGGKLFETAGGRWQIPFWTRYVVHSTTNIDSYYSEDGVTFSTYALGIDPSLTAGGVMFMSFACTTEWDWIRFT